MAAVLIPFVWEGDEPHIIFTKRTETVEHHRGQISFPGGHHDAEDLDLRTTALREAEEEIGLSPSQVDVVGQLSDYLTRTSIHHVTPFVGVVTDKPSQWEPHEHEVAEVLEVPLSDLLSPGVAGIYEWNRGEVTVTTPAYFWRDRTIWGATAEILVDLLTILR